MSGTLVQMAPLGAATTGAGLVAVGDSSTAVLAANPHRRLAVLRNIGDGSGFAFARIHGYQQLVRVFAEFFQHDRRPGHLVAFHAVPSPAHKHVRGMFLRYGDIVLPAQHPAVHPPGPGKFLACRRIVVF